MNIEDEFPDDEAPQTTENSEQDFIDDEAVLLTYLFANPGLYAKAAPIIKPEYFTGKYSDAVKFVAEKYHEFHKVPNRLLISANTGFLPELVTDQHDPMVEEIISGSIESFCRKQATNTFLLEVAERVSKDRSNKTMAEFRERMDDIGKISMARDLGTEFHEDYREMMIIAKDHTNISTGSEYLDMVFGGGLTRPSMNIYSAATGDGKSIFLANRAIDYIRKFPGEAVVYYTLENSAELTYQRLAAMMAEIDIRIVLDQVDDVASYVYKSKGKEGRLFIKRMNFRGTTMSDVQAHFYDLRATKSANLRMGVLDYMELLSPSVDVKVENIHVRDEQVANETYDFVHREKLIWWTAAQQTKGADEETEAKKGKVSGGVKKIFACDNLIIGKRTDDDAMQQRIWGHCKKARSSGGINAAIPIFWDRKTQRMTDWRGPNGNERGGDDSEFRRANPRLFGILGNRGRIESDPVASEMGVGTPEKPIPAPNATAKNIRDSLINRIRGTASAST